MSDTNKSMVDMQIEDLAKAQDIPLHEAAAQFRGRSQHLTDLDNLPKQEHIWIDRGLKFTCETAAHPWHEAWKRRPTPA